MNWSSCDDTCVDVDSLNGDVDSLKQYNHNKDIIDNEDILITNYNRIN